MIDISEIESGLLLCSQHGVTSPTELLSHCKTPLRLILQLNAPGGSQGFFAAAAGTKDEWQWVPISEDDFSAMLAQNLDGSGAVLKRSFSAEDAPTYPIGEHFGECSELIEAGRANNGTVAVYCLAGASRSAAVVAAYLMKLHGVGWKEAIHLVQSKRTVVSVNAGFVHHLQLWELFSYHRLVPRTATRTATLFLSKHYPDETHTFSFVEKIQMLLRCLFVNRSFDLERAAMGDFAVALTERYPPDAFAAQLVHTFRSLLAAEEHHRYPDVFDNFVATVSIVVDRASHLFGLTSTHGDRGLWLDASFGSLLQSLVPSTGRCGEKLILSVSNRNRGVGASVIFNTTVITPSYGTGGTIRFSFPVLPLFLRFGLHTNIHSLEKGPTLTTSEWLLPTVQEQFPSVDGEYEIQRPLGPLPDPAPAPPPPPPPPPPPQQQQQQQFVRRSYTPSPQRGPIFSSLAQCLEDDVEMAAFRWLYTTLLRNPQPVEEQAQLFSTYAMSIAEAIMNKFSPPATASELKEEEVAFVVCITVAIKLAAALFTQFQALKITRRGDSKAETERLCAPALLSALATGVEAASKARSFDSITGDAVVNIVLQQWSSWSSDW